MNKPQNHTKSDYERAEEDWYVEPSWCVEALADYTDIRGTIWDPACGSGTIPKVFAARGHEVLASDVVDRGFLGTEVYDFLSKENDPWWWRSDARTIVTNPPFDQSEAFVRKALSNPGVGQVCIIQQTRFLNSKGRYTLFTEYPPTDVMILSRRPSMPPGNKLEEMIANGTAFKGGAIDYVWIIWRRGYRGDTRLQWLNPT